MTTINNTARQGRRAKTPAGDAYTVHDQFWADSGGDIDLPVDPYEIAQSMGIRVYRAVLGPNHSGYLSVDGGSAAIYVNETQSRNRNRFTVAHELGHYVDLKNSGRLHETNTRDRDERAAQGTDSEEIYANRFAAALLMPKDEVTSLHARGLSTARLASRFRVSEAAMQNRLSNLGLA